jgi:hypothetical protein
LEHGGAAPAIIDRNADLDRLIEPLAKGGYYHAGQLCASVQRIYVHADLGSAFLDRFSARVAALRVGDPLSPKTEVGPLIHPREADRVLAWTDEAVSAGAKLIAADASAGDLFFEDLSNEVVKDDVFQRFLTFPNVIVTGPQAFFTREALAAIAQTTLQNIADLEAAVRTPRDWSRLPQRSHLPVGSPRELPAEPDPCRFGLSGDFDTALAVIASVFTWVRLAQRIRCASTS